MNDVERAISQIEEIRAQLAASTRFRGIAPKGSALTGVLACVVAIAQTVWPDALAQDHLRYVAVWAVFTIASVMIVAIEAISISRALHGPMADALLGAVSRQILPFGGAGVVITFAICRFSPDAAWMLPGIWQILVALIGFGALPSLPRNVVWAARWYFLSGSVVLGLAGSSGTLSPWMMGFPLAVGQAVVVIILRKSGEHDACA